MFDFTVELPPARNCGLSVKRFQYPAQGTPELSAREYASSIFETRPRDDVGAKAAASAGRRARRAAD